MDTRAFAENKIMQNNELRNTVACLAGTLVACLVGVGLVVVGLDELAVVNRETSHLYAAADGACFPNASNASVPPPLPDPQRCAVNGRLYACGCMNCTLTDKCSGLSESEGCMCPEGIQWPDGTRALAVSNGKLVSGWSLVAVFGIVGLTVVVVLFDLASTECQSMQDDDTDRQYHRLNALCCENTVARVMLVLISPLVSVWGLVYGVCGVLIVMFWPCAVICPHDRGDLKFGDLLKWILFSFKNIFLYPLFAVRACLRGTHPCACWGCAQKLSRWGGDEESLDVDVIQNPAAGSASASREQEMI